jgi:photosystem II stability/assembly factor-like uncharacterized protein
MGTLDKLAIETSVQPGTHRALVLGVATHGMRAIAVGGQGRDLFLASDDGVTFRTGSSPNGGLRTAWMEPDGGIWVVGEYGYAARSSDGGTIWEKIVTGKWRQYQGPCLFGIARDPSGEFWLSGDKGHLMRSSDGVDFKKVKGMDEPTGRMTPCKLGMLIPTDPGHVFLAQGKKIRKLGCASGKALMQVRMLASGTILAVGDGGRIVRSTDEGESFSKIACEDASGLLAGLDEMADGRVVVVGNGGLVLISDDDGATFTKMPQHVSNAQLWCVRRHGAGVLIGGTAGVILRVTNDAVRVEEPAPVKAAMPEITISGPRQTWNRPSLPVEKRDGIWWTPQLRALIHPRRGGVDTGVRPLPTIEEAWLRFRRAAWADDRSGMQRKQQRSTIWKWVTSFEAHDRRRGERLVDETPRRASFEDDAALMAATLERYRGFPIEFHDELWESLADFLVAAEGLPEALRRAYVGLHDELPYTSVGPFGRLRELLAIADDATYAAAKKAILESDEVEGEKAKDSTHRRDDLKWVTTFLLPLGPAAGADERRVHENAMQRVAKFGDFGVHACGLAAGDLSTLERFLKANQKVRHEFFAGYPHRHIASILDVEGVKAAHVLAGMKLAAPFEDSGSENIKWCELLAHIDDQAALDALYRERSNKVSESWGIAALLIAARIDFDRVHALAKKHDDVPLLEMLERERGKKPEEPLAPFEDPNVALSKPTEWVAPTPSFPVLLANPIGLAPEITWREGEQQNGAPDRDWTKWNGAPLAGAKADAIDAFVAHCEKWKLPSGLPTIAGAPARVHERLYALGFDFGAAYWAAYAMRPILERHGLAALPVLLATLQNDGSFEAALPMAQPVGDVSLAPTMIEAFGGKKYKSAARSWILRHPRHAAAGALELFAKDGNDNAARVLRYLDTRGHRDTIVDFAKRMKIDAAVVAMLDQDPLEQPKVKKPVVPPFAKDLPKLGAPKDVETLLVRLAWSNADEIHPGVLATKRAHSAKDSAAFAWALFEKWLAAGADPKHGWCMQAVGFLGDDESARELAALAKVWPGEGKSARAQSALDALLNIGSDVALVNINILAEKSKFPAFKQAARERIEAIADARGLTPDELADRLVPTLGLDEHGAGVLDFGARKFTIAFDERLAPVVRDASGAVLSDLPKPAKTDDAALAKEAKAKLAAIKKDARTTASLQIARMERAMRTGRPIARELFLEAFAAHPWMRHLAQRLVFGAHTSDGKLVATFRVAEDGTLANEKDVEYKLPEDAHVSVLHPARMPKDSIARWADVLGEYELLQPFPQIARPVHAATDAEKKGTRIERFHGKDATYGALRGLESRGWQRWMDDVVRFVKPIGKDGYVELETDPGWHPSQTADDIEPQKIGDVVFRHGTDTLGTLDPVVFSEIVYDLESLTS